MLQNFFLLDSPLLYLLLFIFFFQLSHVQYVCQTFMCFLICLNIFHLNYVICLNEHFWCCFHCLFFALLFHWGVSGFSPLAISLLFHVRCCHTGLSTCKWFLILLLFFIIMFSCIEGKYIIIVSDKDRNRFVNNARL